MWEKINEFLNNELIGGLKNMYLVIIALALVVLLLVMLILLKKGKAKKIEQTEVQPELQEQPKETEKEAKILSIEEKLEEMGQLEMLEQGDLDEYEKEIIIENTEKEIQRQVEEYNKEIENEESQKEEKVEVVEAVEKVEKEEPKKTEEKEKTEEAEKQVEVKKEKVQNKQKKETAKKKVEKTESQKLEKKETAEAKKEEVAKEEKDVEKEAQAEKDIKLVDVGDVQEAQIMGKYFINHENGEFFFTLNANNSKVLFLSEKYKTYNTCKKGIENFKKYVEEGAFGYEKVGKEYRCILKRPNGTYMGNKYTTKAAAESNIESVKRFYMTQQIITK